jgi:hypothetical protein
MKNKKLHREELLLLLLLLQEQILRREQGALERIRCKTEK